LITHVNIQLWFFVEEHVMLSVSIQAYC
jgi:hypothetical protein